MFGLSKNRLFSISNRVQNADYNLYNGIPAGTKLKVKSGILYYKHKPVGSIYTPLVEYLNKMVSHLTIDATVKTVNPFEVVLDVSGELPEVQEARPEAREHEYTYRTTFADNYPLLVPDREYDCGLTPKDNGVYVSISGTPIAVISSKDGKREKTLARMLASNECITTAKLTLIAAHAELLTTVRF